MTVTRGRFLPLRTRVTVAFLALCGLSAGFVVADAVGAGHSFGLDTHTSAQAAVCLLNPQGCDSASIDSGAVTVRRKKRSGGSPGTPGSKTIVSPIIIVPAPTLDPRNLAFACSLLSPAPWYCPRDTTRTTPAVPATDPITLSDIAAFVPMNPSLESEPNGWGILGLPVNFVGESSVHARTGTLLSERASVRFMPVRYIWQFGDGVRVATTSPGRSWRSLGLPDFSTTPTSHVYLTAQRFRARLTVYYRADYSIGAGPWRPITGTISRSTTTSVAIGWGGEPLLVARDCLNARAAPGC